jgi:tetratricopeptide (TPR) repeat protein
MATVYSQAKRPDQARRWIARYDAEVTDSLQRLRDREVRHRALGWVAIAEGRGRDAVSEFRQASVPSVQACQQNALAGLGLAFDIAGQLDSVRTTYERYLDVFESLCTMGADAMWRAPILKRLGELYEQKGDRIKAAGYYQQFVDLWQKADPDLQPKVAEVRRRLARLSDREKK